MALTRRKFVTFALVAASLPVLLVAVAALSLDLYLHQRAERSAGLNRWGYRGPVVGSKAPGERRVVMLGGSTVFGYGVTWDEAIPAALERALNAVAPPVARVINLGYNNEGAHAFRSTLQDFAYLDYDVVVLYEGYNDLSGDHAPNRSLYRHESPVFRLTGYFPILPVVFREKALALRSGGDLDAAYAAARGEDTGKTVFRPNLVDRTSASALEASVSVSEALGRQLDRFAAQPPAPPPVTNTAGCASPWVHYCDAVDAAVQFARAGGKSVVVVSQPAMRTAGAERHAEQRAALLDMMVRRYSGDTRVRHVDFAGLVDLSDLDLAFDGMHLGVDGNRIVAQALVEPVKAVIAP